jgi:DNA-binding MarR family transcriptional regulator
MSRRSASPRTSRRAYSPTGSAAALYGLLASVARRDPRDLSLTSLATLSTLERTGPRRITDLAAIEGVTQPSMTVLVTALARSGLVVRKTDPTDKRVALVALTPHGLDYLRNRRQAGTQAFAQLIDKLPRDQAAALAAAIPALQQIRDLDNKEREPASRHPRGGRTLESSRT